MKAFIQDRERVLDSENDLLKTGVYADNLVKVIENTPKDKVFTIGVFGGWGTGKSSIIRTAQEKIEKEHSDVKFITYDAWKYANDSFRRMFLLKVQQELKMQQTEDMQRFYQSENSEQEPKTVVSTRGLVVVIIVLLFILALVWLTPLNFEWKVGITTLGSLLSLIVSLLNGCFYDLKLTINKPALFAPEQFEVCFKQMMSKCLKRMNWIEKTWSSLKDFVEVGEFSVIGLEKLIIVIDNIDRCPSDIAYQMLTDIKTFLSNADYNLVFIVPVDDEALKKHLFRRWNKQVEDDDINREKEEFLRKFFNVTLRIKPHQETELQHFAHEINRENDLNYSNDTLAIVAKEFSDNPRRIIQLLNNLSGDLALYEEDFVEMYETAICAALILREEYPKFYKKATRNLDLIRRFSDKDAIDDNGKTNSSLVAFMRVSDVILKSTPLDALQRIFTNTSSIFRDLPVDLQKSVRSYDTKKVIEFAAANKDKQYYLVDFLIDSLTNDSKYGASSQITQWIDFMSQLYKAGIFDASRFNAINDSLSPYYKNAILTINKPDALCYMGRQMNASGIPDLRRTIIEFLNGEKSNENENFANVLKAYYAIFTSEQDCIDIAEMVENYYVDIPIDQDIVFTNTQKKIFFGDSFVLKQIEHIAATDDESRIEDVKWCIKNNEELSSETFKALFAKFIELFGNTRGKGKVEYLKFINHLQVLFDVLPTKSLTDELATIYDVVTQPRGIPHPSYPGYPQRDTLRSILDEVETDEAKSITAFCYEVMRITGGSVNVASSIDILYSKCKNTVLDGALRMHSLGLSINSLSSTLIRVDDYESAKDLSILEIVLTRDEEGRLHPDDDTVKEKIHTLVNNSNNNGVESLLNKLVSDKQIKDFVSQYVASLKSEVINTLPVSIAKHAISSFGRENSSTYKDNVDFLILVLRQGNASQKKEVVRQMKIKITNEEDIDNVVSVLDNLITEDQQMLRTLVGELETLKDSDTVGGGTKERVAELVSKLSLSIKKDSLLKKVIRRK